MLPFFTSRLKFFTTSAFLKRLVMFVMVITLLPIAPPPFVFVDPILTGKCKEKVKRMVKNMSSYETIAHSPHSLDIFVVGVKLFKLLTDIAHMHLNGLVVAYV